ncbi:MAG: hypothetical protein WCY87_05740 [Candidatus Cloacimonadales bacterium]|nr:hypothetical protein [Candidatus Cloacimonadota bacterium]MCB5256331.1 hypothetical protein [Candidatus Cloacimonadota bacterium]MCK9435258.1 hypothetical protein [Candidatus Cloacimonadota bacterium]MDD4791149.1 hypothetical protein [Candidatus Cloacimonadota bacterium]MDD5537226.1 hypothetical protein [Candidatus Cloacimonadota bacterium]
MQKNLNASSGIIKGRAIINDGVGRIGNTALSNATAPILLSQRYTDCDLSDEQKERRPSAN